MFKLRRFLVQRSMSPVRIFHMYASVIVLLPKPDICLAVLLAYFYYVCMGDNQYSSITFCDPNIKLLAT